MSNTLEQSATQTTIKVAVVIHGERHIVNEHGSAPYALIAATNAQSVKKRDHDASQECDIIIDQARPILATQARQHVVAASESKDWRQRAALMKRSLAHYRASR